MPTNSPTAHDPRPPFQAGPHSAVAERGLHAGPRSSRNGYGLWFYSAALYAAIIAFAMFAGAGSAHAETIHFSAGYDTGNPHGLSLSNMQNQAYFTCLYPSTDYTFDAIRMWVGGANDGSGGFQAVNTTGYVAVADMGAGNSHCDSPASSYGGDSNPFATTTTRTIVSAGYADIANQPATDFFFPSEITLQANHGYRIYIDAAATVDYVNVQPTGVSGDPVPYNGGHRSTELYVNRFNTNFWQAWDAAIQLLSDAGIPQIDTSYTHVVNTGPVPEDTDPFTQYAQLSTTTVSFSGDFYITEEDYDNQYGPTIDEVWVYLQNMDVDNAIDTFKVGDVDAPGFGSFELETELENNRTYRYFYYFVSTEDPGTTYFYNGIRYTFTIGTHAGAASLGLTDINDRYSLATSTCTVLNPTGCMQNAIVFLFWPSGNSLAQFQTLSLKERFPFSYMNQFGAIKDALYGNADTAPAAISVDIGGFGEITFLSRDMVASVPFANLIKEMLSAVLWFFLAYALYRAVIRAHDTQTHV